MLWVIREQVLHGFDLPGEVWAVAVELAAMTFVQWEKPLTVSQTGSPIGTGREANEQKRSI